jgi:hypothetical protein
VPIQRTGDGFVSQWLRAETPEQLRMLERMRDRLKRKLDRADKLDAEPGGDKRDPIPDRDWCRVYEHYQRGYTALLVEERERTKLALMERRLDPGDAPLTDEEYETGTRELGLEALRSLPVDQLAPELARRGIKLIVAPPETEEKDG